MDFSKIGWFSLIWHSQFREQLWAHVSRADKDPSDSKTSLNFLIREATIGFSRKAVLYGVRQEFRLGAWLLSYLLTWSVGQSIGPSVRRSVGPSVGPSVSQSISQSVSQVSLTFVSFVFIFLK